MNILKKIILGLILSTQVVSLNLGNAPTELHDHKSKNKKLHAAAFGLASATFGCASAASAYGAIYLQNWHNFEATKAAAHIGTVSASFMISQEKKDEIDDTLTNAACRVNDRASFFIMLLGALSYISLQSAQYCWEKSRKSSAEI